MANKTIMKQKAEIFVKEHKDDSKENAEKQGFWIDFLDIFGIKQKEVSQFEWNVKDIENKDGFIDLFWKGNLVVEHKSKGENLDSAFNQALGYTDSLSANQKPNYIIVSDFEKFRLINFMTKKKKEFLIYDLPDHITDFSFIYNYGKIEHHDQEELTLKASEILAKIHDELVSTNYNQHDLELFLMRLLFCLYAEDTGIFNEDQFYNYIKITEKNEIPLEYLGSKIQNLFRNLDKKESERQTNIPEEIREFPYVNGNLFSEPIDPPSISPKMYSYLLKACDFEWNTISPSIFGSLFQYVMDEEARRDFGSHYTSEENILKLINSLFMNKLWNKFNKAIKNKSKKDKLFHLEKLREKIGQLKFFDPACGSGNFLIVAYRELRLLEYRILEEIMDLESNLSEWRDKPTLLTPDSITNIKIDNFYGIEIDEFSSKIAQVSMWFIEHQMNLKYETLDLHSDNLPLKQYVNIVNANSLRIDWTEVIKPDDNVYVLGNPPFGGKQNQNEDQKEDMKLVFKGFKNIGKLDYVTAWYKKALDYMTNTTIETAFVSTNSICQGEQVPTLWTQLRKKYDNFYINFAHQTFKWSNEAKNNASVFCIIIGFSYIERKHKSLYTYKKPVSLPQKNNVKQINSYLIDMNEIVPLPNRKALCDVPPIIFGSMPNDGGNLIINSEKEKKILIENEPKVEKYIRKLISSKEYIKGKYRYCLWLVNASPTDLKIPTIKNRIEKVKEHRLSSTREETVKLAEYPSLFGEIRQPKTDYIFIPLTTTSNREYIPFDFIDKSIISNNTTAMIPSDSKYIMGILMSKMHMIWIKIIGGKLKGDYRYSTSLYNNFPFPTIDKKQQEKIENCVKKILKIRKKYNTTLFVLYDPLTMPPDLKKAHNKLDKEVEKLYMSEDSYEKGMFNNEMDCLKFLLQLYEKNKKLIS